MDRKKTILLFVILILSAGIAVWGGRTFTGLTKSPTKTRCAFDGTPLRDLYRVEMVLQDDRRITCCSIYCAQQYARQNREGVRRIRVVDENSGRVLEADRATYVHSRVVSVPEVNNRIHVFAAREEALDHARQFGGHLIPNPFL